MWQILPTTFFPSMIGETQFLNGDKVTILEVRGTADTFKPANIYWIKGTYTLSSHDRALLLASTTATEPGQGVTRDFESQRLSVNRGTGGFALFLPMSYTGFPHVSFYPADGEAGFGGTYFGTDKSVLKESGGGDGENVSSQRIWDVLGLRLAETPRGDARLIKSKYEGGLQVIEVRPDSPASRSSIQKDDVLVGLDKWSTWKMKDVFWALGHPRVDDTPLSTLRFHVARAGDMLYGDLILTPGQ